MGPNGLGWRDASRAGHGFLEVDHLRRKRGGLPLPWGLLGASRRCGSHSPLGPSTCGGQRVASHQSLGPVGPWWWVSWDLDDFGPCSHQCWWNWWFSWQKSWILKMWCWVYRCIWSLFLAVPLWYVKFHHQMSEHKFLGCPFEKAPITNGCNCCSEMLRVRLQCFVDFVSFPASFEPALDLRIG